MDPYRLLFHLMPPQGWLNDPNGLCQFHGTYHVFFQYSPENAEGGLKLWGHYTSTDLIHWNYEGAPLVPDREYDKDGVYSGCAFLHEDQMYLYYTGNVKQPGIHDFVHSGREANTVLVTSKDGKQFSPKECIMTNADYPEEYTCHIRDPKVWQQDGRFYMVQGGRLKGDKGTVLVFQSEDLRQWSFHNDVTISESFGYMWECPDYFELPVDMQPGAQMNQRILSLSPQGLEAETYRYQNIYQSGYFRVVGDITQDAKLQEFTEWDMGFDFYAPQTFQDEQGRRILIGWAGMPDADYDNLPTVKQGWQHALTVPRELIWRNGRVCQNPVSELEQLRQDFSQLPEGKKFELMKEQGMEYTVRKAYEIEIAEIDSADFLVKFDQNGSGFALQYTEEVFSLEFYGEKAAQIGRGRTKRQFNLDRLQKCRILLDTSLVEVYLNDGEYALTSRYYIENDRFHGEIHCQNGNRSMWEWKGYQCADTFL